VDRELDAVGGLQTVEHAVRDFRPVEVGPEVLERAELEPLLDPLLPIGGGMGDRLAYEEQHPHPVEPELARNPRQEGEVGLRSENRTSLENRMWRPAPGRCAASSVRNAGSDSSTPWALPAPRVVTVSRPVSSRRG
jgi:hypothetical protein